MNLLYQEPLFALQLFRHLALAFLSLGLLYGWRVHKYSRLPHLSPLALLLPGIWFLWHAILFLWLLFLWNPVPLGAVWHVLLALPLPATLPAFWPLRPDDPRWRAFWLGVLASLLSLTGLALLFWLGGVPNTRFLRGVHVLLALGVLVLGAYGWRHPLTRGKQALALMTALLTLSALLDAWTTNDVSRLFFWTGWAEVLLFPLAFVWPYLWPEHRIPSALRAASQKRPAATTVLAPYLEHLDLLLQQTQDRSWTPVPFMIQAVLTHLEQRLDPKHEPRAHVPLPRLLERVLDRHQEELSRRHLALMLEVDPQISVDPSLGEWFLDLLLHHLVHHAHPTPPVQLRLRASQDPKLGPVVYAALEYRPAPEPTPRQEAWFLPALLLARLLVLDLGGDWWLETHGQYIRGWLRMPLAGFGRLLHTAPQEITASPASSP